MNPVVLIEALSLFREALMKGRPQRAVLFAAFVGLGLWAAPANAQYGSTFSYFNPSTGFGYSQGWGMGRNSYAGGFSVRMRNFGYSTYGGYSPGRYFGGSTYANRRYLYSHGYTMGRHSYQGGTVFARSPYYVPYVPYYPPVLARPIVATPMGAAPLMTAAPGSYVGSGQMTGGSGPVAARKPGSTAATAGIRPLD